MPSAARQIRANLRTPLPLSFIDYGKAGFGGFAEYYPKRRQGRLRLGRTIPALQARARRSGARRRAARCRAWPTGSKRSARAPPRISRSAPTRFAQMLRDTEMVDLPLAELEAIGRADLKRNQDALRAACARYAPGATMQACMDRMGANKPQGGAVAGARAQLAGLKRFIDEKDLVSIPGTEEAQVEESPPYNRQNFAYIDIPGPYENGLPSVYYIAPPDPTWPAEVQADFVPGEADLLFTSVHEVWPGHFLNFLHSNRSPFTFGRVFVGYAFAEGWAHYTEEMMWDAGLGDGDPETHIGQLSNALLRDCRYLSAIGMHTGRMTLEQSRQLFLDRMLSGRRQCPAAGGARHLRSGLSQLHDGQADDPPAARRLDAHRGGRAGLEGVPRQVPELWRPADPAGPRADDGRRARRRCSEVKFTKFTMSRIFANFPAVGRDGRDETLRLRRPICTFGWCARS